MAGCPFPCLASGLAAVARAVVFRESTRGLRCHDTCDGSTDCPPKGGLAISCDFWGGTVSGTTSRTASQARPSRSLCRHLQGPLLALDEVSGRFEPVAARPHRAAPLPGRAHRATQLRTMLRERTTHSYLRFGGINGLVLVLPGVPVAVGREAAFAAGFRSELAVLRKTALFIGNASTPLAGDFPLFLRIHGRKAPIRGANVLSHGPVSDHVMAH